MKLILILAVSLVACCASLAQGTYTAASCSQADVADCINGTGANTCVKTGGGTATHTAINGDKIIIPTTGTPCSWTSGIVITVSIDITGTGTPNTGGGTMGAGSSATTLNETGSSPFFAFRGITSTTYAAQVELLTLSTTNTSQTINGAVTAYGVCTGSAPYCPSVRFDNITFTSGEWGQALAGGAFTIDNVFGVVDHNTETENSCSACFLVDMSVDAWQGVGTFGDNSFASADTFGTAQAFYIENNVATHIRLSEDDVSPTGSGGIGGGRWVCRFNSIPNMSGDGMCGAHGTSWTSRGRGQRQVEAYYNTGQSTVSCNVLNGILSGTGYYLSNSFTGVGCNNMLSVDNARFVSSPAPVPFYGRCDGTEPWDFSPWVSATSPCLDQPGRGAGVGLLAGGTSISQTGSTMTPPGVSCSGAPVGTCYPAGAFDPIYEAGETSPNSANGISVATDGSQTLLLANRDYYGQVSATAQTSATSPFNGTTGTGYGTLANRPATCVTNSVTGFGVGYSATDQGTWNTYNSQQGTLYICTATNTWTVGYVPYVYPHPLDSGTTTAAPTNLSIFVVH